MSGDYLREKNYVFGQLHSLDQVASFPGLPVFFNVLQEKHGITWDMIEVSRYVVLYSTKLLDMVEV